MKLHLGCADDIRAGFENLDPAINGWRFEAGLPYPDGSVEGITISHALMYVEPLDMGAVAREFYRVLVPGGVVRITEDDCESRSSARYMKPYPGAKQLTGPRYTGFHLRWAGFDVRICNADETHFSDNTLLIAHREHKQPRYVFYLEAIKCLAQPA